MQDPTLARIERQCAASAALTLEVSASPLEPQVSRPGLKAQDVLLHPNRFWGGM